MSNNVRRYTTGMICEVLVFKQLAIGLPHGRQVLCHLLYSSLKHELPCIRRGGNEYKF